MGVRNFFANGGEPLMRKDIFEVLSFAKAHRLKVGIATNGSLIPEYKEEIASANLDSIMVFCVSVFFIKDRYCLL